MAHTHHGAKNIYFSCGFCCVFVVLLFKTIANTLPPTHRHTKTRKKIHLFVTQPRATLPVSQWKITERAEKAEASQTMCCMNFKYNDLFIYWCFLVVRRRRSRDHAAHRVGCVKLVSGNRYSIVFHVTRGTNIHTNSHKVRICHSLESSGKFNLLCFAYFTWENVFECKEGEKKKFLCKKKFLLA